MFHWAWFRSMWYSYRRQRDLMIMWPIMRSQAKNIEGARDLFSLHANRSKAWLDLGPDELHTFIDTLE